MIARAEALDYLSPIDPGCEYRTPVCGPTSGLSADRLGLKAGLVHAGFGIYRALLDSLDYRLDQNASFNATQSIKNIAVSKLNIVPGQPASAGSLISPSGIQPDAYTPTLLSWSLNIEQQVAPGTSLTLGYIGSHG